MSNTVFHTKWGRTKILKAVYLKFYTFQYSCCYQNIYLPAVSMVLFLLLSLPTLETCVFGNFVPWYDIWGFHLILVVCFLTRKEYDIYRKGKWYFVERSLSVGSLFAGSLSHCRVCVCVCLCVYTWVYTWVTSDSAIPWTVACQAPLSMRFSRQAYWSGLPYPPQGDLPNPEIESVCFMYPALAGGFFTTSAI